MKKLALTAVLCAITGGCSIDELVLSSSEQQDLADNLAAAIIAYQDLAEFALRVAMGDAQLTDADVTDPTEANGWTGMIDYTGNEFPGGDGTISMTYVVKADGVPVDPQVYDFSDTQTVQLDMTVSFTGTSKEGAPLTMDADFTLGIDVSNGLALGVEVDGAFNIGHNQYDAAMTATDFVLSFDEASQALSTVQGSILGGVDIPNYAFDADLSITGAGDRVDFVVKVSGTTVSDSVTVQELVDAGS